jgi:ribosome biogenesis protein MAK21
MGKKRTHAETKDGATKPAPDKNRMSAKNDKKDKREDGKKGSKRAQLVGRVAV